MSKTTPGPWRWEINQKSRGLHLVGGVPRYDLTVMDFERWGMSGATIRLRDTAHAGLQIMHKIHERQDWIAAFPGRDHHAHWCAGIVHPDARLMAAAPELLEALVALHAVATVQRDEDYAAITNAAVAIQKATGEKQ